MSSDMPENCRIALNEQEEARAEAQAEEYNLEMGREMEAERKEEHRREGQEGIFDSWKSDNFKQLKDDFIEENEQEFSDFCKEEFKLYEDSK